MLQARACITVHSSVILHFQCEEAKLLGEIWKPIRGHTEEKLRLICIFLKPPSSLFCNHLPTQETSPKNTFSRAFRMIIFSNYGFVHGIFLRKRNFHFKKGECSSLLSSLPCSQPPRVHSQPASEPAETLSFLLFKLSP